MVNNKLPDINPSWHLITRQELDLKWVKVYELRVDN